MIMSPYANTIMPTAFYLVVSGYGDAGIATRDPEESETDAYNEFSESVKFCHPVVVSKITTQNGVPVQIEDVTQRFRDMLIAVCQERGLDAPEFVEFKTEAAQ
jgi:hypothetical protein